mmetsp:Transcript_51950/g.86158  ORF Transcript_51950/g.86158 Transcript_51950/m.86158 type:complete len:116 (+) Transcript_51950:549-896(+)
MVRLTKRVCCAVPSTECQLSGSLSSEHAACRDAWVAAIEQAKLKAWSAQEQSAFDQVAAEARRAPQQNAAVDQIVLQQQIAPAQPQHRSPQQGAHHSHKTELIPGGSKQGCCVLM